MIFGTVADLDEEAEYFSEHLKAALRWLAETDFSKLPNGRHELEGNRMFVMIFEGETRPAAELKAESHGAYIDVQYVIEGEEVIGYARRTEKQIITDNRMEQDDAFLYKELVDEMNLILRKGTYAVFFPADLHRPWCSLNETGKLRKAVVKIRIPD